MVTPATNRDGDKLRESLQIFLADSPIQEYSSWFGYSGMSAAQQQAFNNDLYTAVESIYEPTHLTVSQAPNNTTQDVHFVPIAASDPNGAVARTVCRLNEAAIYGTHHHRVCDKKQVNVYLPAYNTLSPGDRKYAVLAHEFGHQVGLRHSNTSQPGTTANGTPTTNTHPDQQASLMKQGVPFGAYQLHAHDVTHINDHY